MFSRGGLAIFIKQSSRMSYASKERSTPSGATQARNEAGWPGGLRVIVSIGIILHLSAVLIAPLAGPPPATLLANRLIQPLRPYIGLLYLGHGYRFFAPDPGPGHSITFSVTRTDGGVVTGVVPDPVRDRPRLFYHRRFMVSEKIAALIPPADAPAAVRAEARRDWGPLVQGVARQLLREHDGSRVTLTLVEHALPGPEDILEQRSEPDVETPLGTFEPAIGRTMAAGVDR